MILEIVNDSITKFKNGTYHFGLVEYPDMKEWEWNGIQAFICYEKKLGNDITILCDDEKILEKVNLFYNKINGTEYIPPVDDAIEKYVYHAAGLHAAQQIFASGKLLSATKVGGKTGEEIAEERRESGFVDPPDFYEYIMFGWGSHLVGDYVVLSENFPSEEDLSSGKFDAGVRFYIRYEDIIKHKGHTFDGYHPIKVKEEIILDDYLYACIVPEQYRQHLEPFIPENLISRVNYLTQRGLTLDEWNKKVVSFVSNI